MSEHVSLVVAPTNIGFLTGPILLGNFFGYGLFGVLCAQVFLYTFRYPNDSWKIKIFVRAMLFIEILMTAFATTAAWDFLAAGWGNLAVLLTSDWPLAGLAFLSGLAASSAHVFFCWRIWILRPAYRWLVGVIAVISVLQWVMAALSGVRGLQPGTSAFNVAPFILIWLGGSGLCNILITIAMMFIFLQAGIQATMSGVSTRAKLLVLTLETGMLTSLAALIELLLFAIFPNNAMHFLLFFVLSKLYSNTVMAVLNARVYAEVPDESHGPRDHTGTTIWDSHPPNEIQVTERRDEEAAPLWNELPKAKPNLSIDPVPPIPRRNTPPPVPLKLGPTGIPIPRYPPRIASATWL
ncbi:hypothetical protein BDZ94DRAFT_1246705 [Collybia nuda]|uniref:DUF6534 domain-containing protein n=1 Tax=Collybia nuda TaxID=64659 RepID=A0A9P6CJ56_9AGAR|nr:hypothetical protein BDZ94DRAFT_1246705 [Collybia nuda]